jgi:hypothetical protein
MREPAAIRACGCTVEGTPAPIVRSSTRRGGTQIKVLQHVCGRVWHQHTHRDWTDDERAKARRRAA